MSVTCAQRKGGVTNQKRTEVGMVWLIECYGTRRWLSSQGWRHVALSQRVWERCVVVPEGVWGQSEDIRIWDLLVFLGDALWHNQGTPHRSGNRVGFNASVVNDNRDWGEDDRFWLPTRVPLVARAGLAADGSSCLFVTLQGEPRPR